MTKKQTILSIAGAAVFIGAIALFVFLRDDTSKYIQYKDPGLTTEQKQAIEGRVNAALERLKSLDGKDENELFKAYLTLASEYYPLGEYAKSRENYLRAIELKPDQPQPYYALATVEMDMTNYKGAMEHIDKALELLPQDANYWRFKVAVAQKLNWDKGQILSLFEQAAKAANNHVDVTVSKAYYLAEVGDLAGAVDAWKRAIELDPGRKAIFEQEIAKLQAKLQ